MARKLASVFAAVFCVLATLSVDTTTASNQLDLIRFISARPWAQHHRSPQYQDLEPSAYDKYQPQDFEDQGIPFLENDDLRASADKRSAVATALNAGRRRRQPTPALGKVVTPYVGVGVLNDVGLFFDSLRDNLETLASLSPQQRATLFQDTPSVVSAPAHGTSGGVGTGFRRLHALRPLRPTGNIRSYNRRSFPDSDGMYAGANRHDPGLLWAGLGRR